MCFKISLDKNFLTNGKCAIINLLTSFDSIYQRTNMSGSTSVLILKKTLSGTAFFFFYGKDCSNYLFSFFRTNFLINDSLIKKTLTNTGRDKSNVTHNHRARCDHLLLTERGKYNAFTFYKTTKFIYQTYS